MLVETTFLGSPSRKIIVEIELGTNFNVSFVTVPVNSIIHSLCAFPGGEKLNRYYVVLSKRNWSRLFRNNINRM